MLFRLYKQNINVIMSQPSARSFYLEDDFEEIPDQFDAGKQTPLTYYNSNKLYSHLTINKSIEKEIKKQQVAHYINKTQQYLQNKTQKISFLKNQQDNRLMTDCTFKPNINKSRSKSSRNIKQFLDSQQKHLQKIEEKKEILKDRIQQENRKNMTFSPRINCLKGNRNKENVHERLYKQKDKEDKLDTYLQTYTHIPKITARGQKIERNMPVGELLYQDAKRRAQKSHEIPQTESKNTERNYIQQKYAAQKFLKDYKNALHNTHLQQRTEYNNEELFLLMKQMGYARYLTSPNHSLFSQQKKLLQDCFSYLEQVGVTQINVYVFLLALSGIYSIDLNNDQIKGVLVIDEEQGRKIHQYFDLLFRNRLFTDVSRKEKSPIKEQHNFRPSINPVSQVMAQKYRCKMIEKANNIFSKNNMDIQISEKGLSHEELLVICNLGQTLQKQKLREIKLQEMDPECTFQPNHQKYQHGCNNLAEQKCRELYQNAKAKQEQIQKLATFRSFQDKKQLKNEIISPKPRRNSQSITKSKVKSYLEIKDVDKTLARMLAGRQQRNQKREFEERGQKITKKVDSKKKTIQQPPFQNELLLDADIMVNNVKRKIYIYKGQEDKVDEIVDKFAIECDLDEYSKNMLYQRLVEAVRSLKQHESQLLDSSL